MSTVAAYAVLGVPIDTSDLYTRENVSVHEDCPDPGSGKFCMRCGEPRNKGKIISTPMEGYDIEGGEDYGGTFQGLDIVKGIWGDDEEGRCFLAAVYAKDNTAGYDKDRGPGRMPAADWFVSLEKVRKVLEPVGLWVPNDFGIWVVAYYS